MEQWIRFPPEPKELILAWQAPASITDRMRWAVGRLYEDEAQATFHYLQGTEFSLLNAGRSTLDLAAAGFVGYPAFDKKRQPTAGFRELVLEAFLRRLPPPARPDYGDYLAYHLVPKSVQLTSFGALAVTEARLPSDGFSLIDPLDATASHIDVVVEIAGYRHLCGNNFAIHIGQELTLQAEPENTKDSNAVSICADGSKIGYVNRLQASTVSAWLVSRNVSAWVARLNGNTNLPRAFAFLQVRPQVKSQAA